MTLHVYDDLIQGTDEWLAARRGMVTASTVGRLVTTAHKSAIDFDCPACGADAQSPCLSRAMRTNTPGPIAAIKSLHTGRVEVARNDDSPPALQVASNDESRGLTALLVAERITGWTDPTYVNFDMQRGNDCEPIARDYYGSNYEAVTEVGLMVREEDGWTLGYSPDGLVGDDGLLEVKSPRAKTHVTTVLSDEVPAFYMAQLQGGLLVTGRDWIDFLPFVGGLPLWRKRVLPDPRWFDAITAACQQFEKTAAEMVAAYEQATKGLPKTERVPDPFEVELKL